MGGPYRTTGEGFRIEQSGVERPAHDWDPVAYSGNLVLVEPESVSGGVEHVRLNAHRIVTISHHRNDVDSFAFRVLAWGTGFHEWHLRRAANGHFVRSDGLYAELFVCAVEATQCIAEQLFFHAWSGGIGFVDVNQVTVNYKRCLCSKCFEYDTDFRLQHSVEHCEQCASGDLLQDIFPGREFDHAKHWFRLRRHDISGWLGHKS